MTRIRWSHLLLLDSLSVSLSLSVLSPLLGGFPHHSFPNELLGANTSCWVAEGTREWNPERLDNTDNQLFCLMMTAWTMKDNWSWLSSFPEYDCYLCLIFVFFMADSLCRAEVVSLFSWDHMLFSLLLCYAASDCYVHSNKQNKSSYCRQIIFTPQDNYQISWEFVFALTW